VDAGITSVAVFMVTLDNLVVTTAIPVIRKDLHASLSGLQWTVNAYTLTFAVPGRCPRATAARRPPSV
jgi:MFS family permease